MGVVAYANPPLGGRKHGHFDQFLRFFSKFGVHSYVYLHALNKATINVHTTSDPLQDRAEWGCWRTHTRR